MKNLYIPRYSAFCRRSCLKRRSLYACVCLCFCLSLCFSLFGCAKKEETASGVSSGAESSAQTSGEPSEPAGEESSQSGNVAPESQDTESSSPENSEEPAAFTQKFQENPLDAAYRAESEQAVSNLEIKAVAEKYAGLWAAEGEAAYDALLEASGQDPEVIARQEEWYASRQEEMEKITQQAQEIGGSLAQAEEATLRMEYFRQRARELYLELFSYEPDFTFAFVPEEE